MGELLQFPAERVKYEPYVNAETAGRHFGVTSRTIRNWRAAGAPHHDVRGLTRYRLSELETWATGGPDGRQEAGPGVRGPGEDDGGDGPRAA